MVEPIPRPTYMTEWRGDEAAAFSISAVSCRMSSICGRLAQVVVQRVDLTRGQAALLLPEEHRDEHEAGNLREKRLRRRDGDLHVGADVEHAVGLARDAAAPQLVTAKDLRAPSRARCTAASVSRRLAGLRDGDDSVLEPTMGSR